MNPPENAIVLCADEKSQIQELDRIAPTLQMQVGIPERQPTTPPATPHHHPVRGTRIATGKVTGPGVDTWNSSLF